MKGEGELQKRYSSFSHDCELKKQDLRDFRDVDFNFTHFANFKCAYFKLRYSILDVKKTFGIFW